MNQTWKNGKTPCFGPDFGPFNPNSGCQNFFSKIWLRQSPITMYNIRKKLMIQSWENLVTDGRTDGSVNVQFQYGLCATRCQHCQGFPYHEQAPYILKGRTDRGRDGRKDRRMERRTRVISLEAVRLTLSVQ